jgi:hypothetical protein
MDSQHRRWCSAVTSPWIPRSRLIGGCGDSMLSVVVSNVAQQADDENGYFPRQPFRQADVLIERHLNRLRF